MLNTILGKKEKMGHTYVGHTRQPITWIEAGPCTVTQVKGDDKDGYFAVQLGFGKRNIKNISKPVAGHLKGATIEKMAPRFLREVRLEKASNVELGTVVKLGDVLKVGDIVKVSGVSKGKGFAGGVKRWGFSGGPKTHGQSDRQRAPGSIGQGTTPGRVYKGKHMAGRMGNDSVTIKNVQVLSLDEETGRVALMGPIPGRLGALVAITKMHSGKIEEKELVIKVLDVVEEEAPKAEVTQAEGVAAEEKKEGGAE